jgi:23S rRNA (guanine745-N1)-methyltransferase
MLDLVVGYLACPVCSQGLTRQGQVVRCTSGHSFDIARGGYVTLRAAPDRPLPAADTSAMVAARERFLGAGHYGPLVAALRDTVARSACGPPGCLVDVGSGPGMYLAALLADDPDAVGVALDASPFASRRAARAHSRIGAVRCDVQRRLPLRSAIASTVLVVFAPRNASELLRIVSPDGCIVVVTPTERHLRELVEPLGLLTVDARKEQRLDRSFGGVARRGSREELDIRLSLSRAAAGDLVAMGPSAHHLERRGIAARLAALPDPVSATASVAISVYWPGR